MFKQLFYFNFIKIPQTLLLIIVIVLFSLIHTANAEISCSFTQITDTPSPTYNSLGVISGDGSTVVFVSNGNIVGDNPDLNTELFLYDVGSDSTNQITNTTIDSRFVFNPSISNDGTQITFQSQANITPPGRNPDESNELYLYDSTTDSTSQVSNFNTNGFLHHDLSANGRVEVVRHGNILLYDLTTTPYSVNRTRGTFGSPSINSDGGLVTFGSSSTSLAPGNSDESEEIFIYNANTNRYSLVTDTTSAFNRFPVISSDGSHIVFISTADLTGDNPDGSNEKFLYDRGSMSFIQITNSPTVGSPGFSKDHNIDADGSRVVYGDDRKVFLFDKDLMDSFEIVRRGDWPSINGAGTRIVFTSTSDLTGENPDHNREVYLAECTPSSPPPPPPPGGNCEVSYLTSPGGTLVLPFPNFVPLCRCFEDRAFREFRCAMINPDFFLVFRTPFPVLVGESFEMNWSFIPLTKNIRNISLETSLPQSFNLKGKKSGVVEFSNLKVDNGSKESLKFIAPKNEGNYPLEGKLKIKGKKGEGTLDQLIRFDLPVFKKESLKKKKMIK